MSLLCFVSYRYFAEKKAESSNFYLTINGLSEGVETLESMTNFLRENSSTLIIKRHERTNTNVDIVYFIEFNNYESFLNTQNGLGNLFPEAEWTFVEDVRVI